MDNAKYTLGLDFSTQSLTAVIVDYDNAHIVCELSIAYTDDDRLQAYGLDAHTKALPEHKKGLIEQPPLLFLDALDCILSDLQNTQAIDLSKIDAIALSAQQHGHVYLNDKAESAFKTLDTACDNKRDTLLSHIFKDSFSYPHAPIWMTSVSARDAQRLCEYVGTAQDMMALSGSASPARFTGAVISYIATHYPQEYKHTKQIQLLSSFLSGVLSANSNTPIDWGNGSGMSLMDYDNKVWSSVLCDAVDAMAKSDVSIVSKLPALNSPISIAGTIAPYFVTKYGFNDRCIVTIGSGDNPQSKVVVSDNLLSLGSSFVLMSQAHNRNIPAVHAMYDGIGRPFVFCCRTNGALVWDRVRSMNPELNFDDFDHILANTEIGAYTMYWQVHDESFPLSPAFDKTPNNTNITQAYPAIIDSSLAIMAYYTKELISVDSKTLYVTGGPTQSKEILMRIASFFNKTVVSIETGGASLGSACSAYRALHPNQAIEDFYAMIDPMVASSKKIEASKEQVAKAQTYMQEVALAYKTIID